MSTRFNEITNALTKNGKLNVKGSTTCVEVVLPTNTTGTTAQQSSTVKLTLKFIDTDPVCKQLKKLPGIKSMCGKSGDGESISSDCKIQIGGSGGIQF